MPRKRVPISSSEVEHITHEVESYPRPFHELLKLLMNKYLEKIDSVADRMYVSSRTLDRLRSPQYRPTLADIKDICLAMKINMVDGLQLLHSGGFDPTVADSEIIEIILICSANT